MSDQRRVTPADPDWGTGRSPRSTGYRSRSYYVEDEWHFRLRNAQWHTQTQDGGYDSISEAVNAALQTIVEDLEATYNGGEPFPDIPERARPKAGPSGRARQAEAIRARSRREQPPETADESSTGPGRRGGSGR